MSDTPDSSQRSSAPALMPQTFASLCIVIPVYRDADALQSLLSQLKEAREGGAEVIVVGTPDDNLSADIARRGASRYIVAKRGRGAQLASGAAASSRALLWFLHADSILPTNAPALVCDALAARTWGRFDVAFDSDSLALRLVAAMMNLRSRWSRIATGDQGIFIRRDMYEAAGGFLAMPLMEDIALSNALRRLPNAGAPACIRQPLITSARKWQREGIVRTIVRMWWWRFRFWWGVRPETLAQEYYRDLV
jgi:rSAM/selenodomain-associated transferase 2